MNKPEIEKEFKELHELLLSAYDEDYEDSLDKALSKLDIIKKSVSAVPELIDGGIKTLKYLEFLSKTEYYLDDSELQELISTQKQALLKAGCYE